MDNSINPSLPDPNLTTSLPKGVGGGRMDPPNYLSQLPSDFKNHGLIFLLQRVDPRKNTKKIIL